MSEFTIRSESVDVEQIMKQIRQRILEKRGADYTEDQIRELASVRLEKFLDPKSLRSDLLEQFRKSRPAVNTEPAAIIPPYGAQEADILATHRGGLRFIRRLLNPILKLFFNSNTLNQVLHTQAQFNVDLLKREARRRIEFDQSRAEWNALYYEVLHNLVLETTRMGIEVQNQRMKVESLSSRLDFSERRVRALEGVVQYRPEVIRSVERERRDIDDEQAPAQASTGSVEGFVPASAPGQGDGTARRRRRRRRGRRGGTQGAEGASGAFGATGSGAGAGSADQGGVDGQGFDDDNGDEGGEEFEPMDAGAEVQEALAQSEAPSTTGAATFAPDEPQDLRRDEPAVDSERKPDSDDDLQ
jgi:hypothetical protein